MGLVAGSVVALVAASAAYLHGPGVPQAVIGKAAAPTTAPSRDLVPVLAPQVSMWPRTLMVVRDGAAGVLVEQYGGLNDTPPMRLRRSIHTTSPTAIIKLVHELNSLPPFPDGVFCPMGDGSYYQIVFTYPDGTSIAVQLDATACNAVTFKGSDQPVAWAAPSPNLYVTLKGLLQASGR
jgi:hypothetical protein